MARVIWLSPIWGVLWKTHGSLVSIEATMSLVIEFFAPLTRTSPRNGVPPSIVQVSVLMLAASPSTGYGWHTSAMTVYSPILRYPIDPSQRADHVRRGPKRDQDDRPR